MYRLENIISFKIGNFQRWRGRHELRDRWDLILGRSGWWRPLLVSFCRPRWGKGFYEICLVESAWGDVFWIYLNSQTLSTINRNTIPRNVDLATLICNFWSFWKILCDPWGRKFLEASAVRRKANLLLEFTPQHIECNRQNLFVFFVTLFLDKNTSLKKLSRFIYFMAFNLGV